MSKYKLLLPLVFCGAANASLIYNTNVILDPGADSLIAAPGTLTNDTVVAVPNWTGIGTFTASQYTTHANSLPMPTDPGPADRGSNFFSGGACFDPAAYLDCHSAGTQFLDVSNQSAQIDSGKVSFVLGGWFGGFGGIFNGVDIGQTDKASLSAIFLSASSLNLGSAVIGPVTLADRTDSNCIVGFTTCSHTELLYRNAAGFIPAGTRQIEFLIQMTSVQGSHNDGYADSLSFIASNPVPEPAPLLLSAMGLAVTVVLARYRRARSRRPTRKL